MSGDRPNVLLVILDSVRAQNTTFHRDDRDTTPNLMEFASEATYYPNAIAPGTASIQSHASIFSGLHVSQHRMDNRDSRLATETVWDVLDSRDYSLGVFSHNPYLTQIPLGFNERFHKVFGGNPRGLPFPSASGTVGLNSDGLGVYLEFLKRSVEADDTIRSALNGIAARMDRVPWLPYSLDDRTGVEITDAFGDWHKKQNGEWAACLNYMDAHTPYVPRTEFSEFSTQAQREFAATLDDYVFGYVSGRRELSELHSLETVYDDCIKQADAEVGRLIRMLEQRGDLENTLVVVTADHGEGFGERGGVREIPSVGHGGTGGPEEGVLRVPLVVQFPGQTAERTVQEPASMIQFSDAVQSVLTGPWETDDFVPEGRTLATCQGLSKMEVESRGIEEQSFSKYDKTSRVAYEFDGGRLLKDAVYDGRGAAFDVTNPREVSRISRPDSIDIVNEQFSPLESVEAIQRESERSVGESVKSRLEELGYI